VHHRMTITLEDSVYRNFLRAVPARRRSQFIEDAIRPLVSEDDLEAGYAAMAADEVYEAEAKEWIEGMMKDHCNDPW
jgi:metal-responsive CopG/Arc/MetJ family transcriptional regulator